MKTINYYFKFIRLGNLLIGSMSVLISALLLNIFNINVFLGMLHVFLIMGFANTMNDILDYHTDFINHPERVLVTKKINNKVAKIICSIFFLLSCILSFFISPLTNFFLYAIIFPSIISYNFFLKKTPILGNLIIAFLLAAIFLYVEILLTNTINILIIPSCLVAGLSFIRELIKDTHDFYGDKKNNYYTLPIIIGIKKSCTIISILIAFLFFLLLLPYFFGIYGIKYLISLVFLIEIPLIYSIFVLMNYPSIKTFKKLIKLHKILTIGGLFILFLTRR